MDYVMVLIMGLVVGAFFGVVGIGRVFLKQIEKIKKNSDKNLMLYHMANEWLMKKQNDKNCAQYITRLGYRKIAIYGMAIMGERLLDELRDTDVEVVYAIDRNVNNIYSYLDVVSPDDELKEVDAIIVTSIAFFDEIKKDLSSKINCPIIALDDIIYSL